MTDKKLTEIKKDALSLQKKVQGIKIVTNKEAIEATEMLSQVKARAKRIEEIRLSYTKPLNDSLRKINSDFKEALRPYAEMESSLKRGILDYRAEEERKRRAEEERLRKEAEARAREEARKKHVAMKKVMEKAPVPVIEKQSTVIASNTSTVRARMVTKFRVVDKNKIPRKYLIVNETAIRVDIRNGISTIPGVEIYQEEELSSY